MKGKILKWQFTDSSQLVRFRGGNPLTLNFFQSLHPPYKYSGNAHDCFAIFYKIKTCHRLEIFKKRENRSSFKQLYIRSTFNPMRTTCRLVKRNSQAYFGLIRRGLRKNSLMCKFVSATIFKPYHNWLDK